MTVSILIAMPNIDRPLYAPATTTVSSLPPPHRAGAAVIPDPGVSPDLVDDDDDRPVSTIFAKGKSKSLVDRRHGPIGLFEKADELPDVVFGVVERDIKTASTPGGQSSPTDYVPPLPKEE